MSYDSLEARLPSILKLTLILFVADIAPLSLHFANQLDSGILEGTRGNLRQGEFLRWLMTVLILILKMECY